MSSLISKSDADMKVIKRANIKESYLHFKEGEICMRSYDAGEKTYLLCSKLNNVETINPVSYLASRLFNENCGRLIMKDTYQILNEDDVWTIEVLTSIDNEHGTVIASPILMPNGDYREYSIILISLEEEIKDNGCTSISRSKFPKCMNPNYMKETNLTFSDISKMSRQSIIDLVRL